MKRAEIARKFDEIVSFAEVDAFIDTPVKRYSSGMYVRLAFAVAAHLEPEILIIDEVLAVGDMEFQKKCLGKMQDVATREGRTVLFVTHNMQAVRHMCQRAVLIENGRVGWLGDVGTAISRYAGNPEGHTSRIDLDRVPRNNTGHAARFHTIEFFDERGEPVHRIDRAHELHARIAFEVREPIRAFDLAMAVTHSGGERVFSETFTDQRAPQLLAPGSYELDFSFPLRNLKAESYFLTLWCWDGVDALDYVPDVSLPEIVDSHADSYKEARRWGIARVPVQWSQPLEKKRAATALAPS
jgi:lipopolysaccharide transport system ATP-binding protein